MGFCSKIVGDGGNLQMMVVGIILLAVLKHFNFCALSGGRDAKSLDANPCTRANEPPGENFTA